jgi:hypothetical protein
MYRWEGAKDNDPHPGEISAEGPNPPSGIFATTGYTIVFAILVLFEKIFENFNCRLNSREATESYTQPPRYVYQYEHEGSCVSGTACGGERDMSSKPGQAANGR